jgi:hypothetical protein
MARHTSRARRNPTSLDFESVSAVVGEKIKHHIQHLRRVAEDSRREADEAHDAWVGGRWDELVSMGVITSRDLHSLEAEEAKLIDLRPYSRNPRKKGADAMHHALQQSRVPWSQMSREEIEAVAQDAAVHGDTVLARRALAALARRRTNPHRGEAHALLADLEAAARTFRPRAHDIRAEAHPDMLEVSFMPEDVPPDGTRGILTPTAKKWGNTVAKLLRAHPEATLPALPGKVGQSHDGRIYARVFLA